jgi:hypothetical protein
VKTLIAVLGLLAATAGASAQAQEKLAVLDASDSLPKGFKSIEATEQEGTKFKQIDALYEDPAEGSSIRFTTARGSKEMAEPGRHAIDVCVRDGKSGEPLLDPQIFGAKPLIEGCTRETRAPESAKKRYPQILDALDSLASVRFKPEYRPEFIALINQTTRAVPEGQEHTEIGGGVLIHKKRPALPPPPSAPAAP